MPQVMFFKPMYMPWALNTGTCLRQGDLCYSAGLHRNHVLATTNTGKIRRGFGKNAGEWPGKVEKKQSDLLDKSDMARRKKKCYCCSLWNHQRRSRSSSRQGQRAWKLQRSSQKWSPQSNSLKERQTDRAPLQKAAF